MSLAFCSMTSRSARLSLSEQHKSVLLNDVLNELKNSGTGKDVTVFAYQHLKVVVELRDQVIKIMTDEEYRRLYPTVTTYRTIGSSQQKVA